MTRKEAIKVLEMFLYKQCDLARTKFAYDANTVWEAVKIATKALEQEPVIDKIRAEIDNALSDGMIHKKTVLGIIDKYKGEVEV